VTGDSEGDVYCDTLEQMELEQVTEGYEVPESCHAAAKALPAARPALPVPYGQALRVVGSRSSARCCGTATLPLGTTVLGAQRDSQHLQGHPAAPLCALCPSRSLVPITKGRLRSLALPVAQLAAAAQLRCGTGGLPGLSGAGSPEWGWCGHLACSPLPAARQLGSALGVLQRGSADPVGRGEEAARPPSRAWAPHLPRRFCPVASQTAC